MRPFEGIKVLDLTHVLAGPFAAYQLGVLGADVIKIENPEECDQSRHTGPDRELNRRNMGTNYLTQNSNKRSITLNLKSAKGRDILKKLAQDADVLIENYRAGAFDALGLGYAGLKTINPRLIYCSMTAFGQNGPRRTQTAYDHAVQAMSGMMAMTGTKESGPFKSGAPVIDYGTGAMAAFAISSALFQRQRTGLGQHIDCAMLDTAFMLEGSRITAFKKTGKPLTPRGNTHDYPSSNLYATKAGQIMLAAGNTRQHTRLFEALGQPELGHKDNEARHRDAKLEEAALQKVMLTKTAQEWEDYLQARHVPALRLRGLDDVLSDPQVEARKVLHRHENVPGVESPVTVPMCAFGFAHGGPSIETPPPRLGEHNAQILGQLGFSTQDIEALCKEGVI